MRAVIFVAFLVTFAVIFARIWVEIGGLSSRAVAKNLMNADVQVPGFRRSGLSLEQVLNRYIPPITIIGGIIIGLVASISDLFGVFGTGHRPPPDGGHHTAVLPDAREGAAGGVLAEAGRSPGTDLIAMGLRIVVVGIAGVGKSTVVEKSVEFDRGGLPGGLRDRDVRGREAAAAG